MKIDPTAASKSATPLVIDNDGGARDAWTALLTAMQETVSRVYSEEMGLAEIDRAEGMRMLAQTFSLAAELFIEKGDPAEPAFTNWMASGRKVLGDNPDARYDSAAVSPDYAYEVTGRLSDCAAQTFTVYGRGELGWNNVAGELIPADMEIAPDGSFSLILSRERPAHAKNWIELNESAHMFLVRQFFNDVPIDKRPRDFEIRRLDAPDAPEFLTEAAIADRTEAAAKFFQIAVDATFGLAVMRRDPSNSMEPPRIFDPAIVGIYYPSVYNVYFGGWFDLEDDEALIFEGDTLKGAYAIVHVMNGWLQSIEGPGGNQRLNKSSLVTKPDGSWTAVVAHKDPGVPNWLNPHGHRQGHFTLRIVHPDGEGTARPRARKVKLSEVADLLSQ
ncbi:MAG: DUF1214 domain-containing protein [Pseudomonadota bacterium]